MTSFLEKDRAEIGKRKKPRFLDKENPLEKVIEKKVCNFAKSFGIESRKYSTPAHRAAPDRIFFIPHRDSLVFFIEFKRKGKKPTPAQLEEHKWYKSLGYHVFVVDSVEDGEFVIGLMA